MPINFGVSALGLQKDNGDLLPRIIQFKEQTVTSHLAVTRGTQVTSFNCTITPKHSTSYILLIANIAVGSDASYDGGMVFTRSIAGGGHAGISNSQGVSASTTNTSFITGMNVDGTHCDQFTGIHADHPNTTNSVEYGLQAYPNGSRSMYINRRGIDATYTARSRLICIEIGDVY